MGLFRPVIRREIRASGDWFTAFRDIIEANKTYSGVAVSQDNATNLPAVYRCWSLNADTVSTTPVDCLAKRGDTRVPYPDPFWLHKPNDEQDWQQFVAQIENSYDADGNAFVLKAVDKSGRLAAMYVLAPTAVTVEKIDGQVVYKVQTNDGGAVFASTSIIHIRGLTPPGHLRGLSPIAAAKQTIGIAFAAEQFGAQFFGTGATLSGVISLPANVSMDHDAAEELKESFQRKHGGVSKSHAVGVLSGGAQWIPLSVKPDEAQFIETRRCTDIQIANLYGIPPEYVADAEGAKGYVTGIYARQYMWLLTGINPRFVRIENAFSKLLPRPAYIKFNRNSFLAMDPKERSEYLGKLAEHAVININEWRAKEDMDPRIGGDQYYISQNMRPADEAKEMANHWTINEKRAQDGLTPIEGGDAIYLPASEIPAIEIEEGNREEDMGV